MLEVEISAPFYSKGTVVFDWGVAASSGGELNAKQGVDTACNTWPVTHIPVDAVVPAWNMGRPTTIVKGIPEFHLDVEKTAAIAPSARINDGTSEYRTFRSFSPIRGILPGLPSIGVVTIVIAATSKVVSGYRAGIVAIAIGAWRGKFPRSGYVKKTIFGVLLSR